MKSVSKISERINSQNYKTSAVDTFQKSVDLWLIAHALAHDFSVVTHERKSKINVTANIKIPNVCEEFQLDCITVFELLSRESAKFVLLHSTNQMDC